MIINKKYVSEIPQNFDNLNFFDIPDDVILLILSQISSKDLNACKFVNKTFFNFIKENKLIEDRIESIFDFRPFDFIELQDNSHFTNSQNNSHFINHYVELFRNENQLTIRLFSIKTKTYSMRNINNSYLKIFHINFDCFFILADNILHIMSYIRLESKWHHYQIDIFDYQKISKADISISFGQQLYLFDNDKITEFELETFNECRQTIDSYNWLTNDILLTVNNINKNIYFMSDSGAFPAFSHNSMSDIGWTSSHQLETSKDVSEIISDLNSDKYNINLLNKILIS